MYTCKKDAKKWLLTLPSEKKNDREKNLKGSDIIILLNSQSTHK